jgi:hypothetical protein
MNHLLSSIALFMQPFVVVIVISIETRSSSPETKIFPETLGRKISAHGV